jgi:putative oxidoreductase
MKIIVLICRILLGLMFFVLGLNNILHFIHMPPPSGDALTWITILAVHHWMNFVGTLMTVSGLLLLVNRFVPLALTLLAPIITCILLYHALLWPHGAAPAILALVLELILIAVYFRSFTPLLAMNPEANTARL